MVANAANADEANPVGFLRFVDFQVDAIQLKLHCFDVSTEFRCRALSIGITDVLVKENLLFVKLQASSVYVRCFRQSHGVQVDEGIIRDGISFSCPNLCFVADLRLVDRELVGYKLIGIKDEPVCMQLCTTFFEFVLLKKLELINSGLYPVKKFPLNQKKKYKKHSQNTVLSKEITNTRLEVIIVHELEDQRPIPLKLVVDVALLSTTQIEIAPSIAVDFADESDFAPAPTGICHQGIITSIFATTGRGLKQVICSVSTLEVSMTQTHQDKGNALCAIGAMEVFVSPRLALIFHSMAAYGERMNDLTAAVEMLLLAAGKEGQSPPAPGTSDSKGSSKVEWGMAVTLQSWKATAVLHSKNAPTEEMIADGENTRMTTKISFPASKQAKQYDVQVEKIRAYVVTPFAKENQKHSAVFLCAEFIFVKNRTREAAISVSSVAASFQSVSVNHPSEDSVTGTSQFPVASMKMVTIKRQDRRAKDSVDTEMSVSISDSHIQWSHQAHVEFLKEWSGVLAIIDKLDSMMSLPQVTSISAEQVSSLPAVSKTLALDVRSKIAEVVLYDVRDVAKAVSVRLKEGKMVRQQQRLTTQTSFECSLMSLLWSENCPAIEVAGVTFQQKILLGPQRQLAKVPVQSNIRASHMKVFMRPELRLLQLLLRFDELMNPKEDTEHAQPHHQKASSRQGISFNCAQVSIEVHEKNAFLVGAGDQRHEIYHAAMDSLGIKSVLSKSFEVNESMLRFLQVTQSENPMNLSAHAQLIDQILGVEGSLTADTLTLLRAGKAFADSRDVEIQFTITDIARTRMSSATARNHPSKTTIFDISAFAKRCEVTAGKTFHERLARILPVVRETFDTHESTTEKADPESNGADWRLRYIGNVDFGVQQCTLLVPYGDSSSAIVDISYVGLGKRVMRISVKDFALNFRQFQKLTVQLSTLRVFLEEPAESPVKADVEPPLQLVFLPLVTFDAMIYWKEETTSEGQSADMVMPLRARQFALSFELSLKSRGESSTTAQVPANEEALVALNWDYVYPLLVYFLTEDEDDNAAAPSDHNDTESRLHCIGIQWDVSVDIVQIAFWDIMTNDVGLLLVTNDFLSHGLAKHSLYVDHQKPGSTDGESPWIIQEATTYIDLLRVYILRNPVDADNYGEATLVESEVLPFNRTKTSNFFFETVGTSYRAIFSPGTSADGASQENDVEALFSEYTGTFHERMHDSFMPIDFKFSLFGSTKLRKASSLVPLSSTSYTLPPMLTPSLSTTSLSPAPKSPRQWAQSVRAKLTRLKRRSSSMDNLLLNDGSCPIQVDSMKLLWTIETRDTVFYTTSLIWDSMQRLAEANKYQQERLRSRYNDSRPGTPGLSEEPVKINSWRSPNAPNRAGSEQLRANLPLRERRGSTRDTLLDLLHQGKLGAKQMPSQEEDGAQGIADGSESRIPTGLGEGEETNASKSIAFKKYTLDIHDTQINIREENSQSSVLVATKHIHLEVGLDDLRSHTVAHLKFDSVTAHIAPIDVDISAGVLWYAYSTASPVQSPRGQSAGSCLLKQVMEECSVSMTYSQALVTGATAVEVELSFLQLSTDRHQFYQLLNVMRHVLLAPPTVIRKPKRAQAAPIRIIVPDLLEHEVSDVMIFPASPSTSVNSMSSKKTHTQLVDELRSREAKQLNSRTSVIPLKFISFRVEGTQFRLRSSPEITGADHEFVEIRGEGIAGCHTYFSNQCTKLILNLQWMEINNLRPGPSSIAFEDAMAVLKAKLLVDKRYQSSSKVNLANQKGMLTIRAESGPLIRVLGQKLRVLDVLEVSMFPEISNIIVIQLASDFYELVYKFFFEQIGNPDHHDLNSEQVLFGRKAVGVHAGQMSPSVRGGRAATAGTPISPGTPTHPRRKSMQMSGSMNGLLLDSNAQFASSSITSSASSIQASENGSLEDDDSSTDGCELFYFKYVRIGNVRLRINCNGFFVNLSDFDLDLPPFVCQSKLCTWKKLLQKFESHLKWYVTKESASSGLSHFKNKFLKWTPSASSSDKKDKNKKDEDSSMQVLFGPYSGSTT